MSALRDYRAAFRSLTDDVLRAEPARFAGVTSEGLAAVAVSFINGCAVQAMIDPDHFDVEEYLAAVQGILGRLSSSGRSRPARDHAADGVLRVVGAAARNRGAPRSRK